MSIANHRQSGFTLIELMIVTAIVAVVAGVAVPNLVSSRAVANERAVVATLRTIATAQSQARAQIGLDTDRDGQGEAMGLGEMAGTVPLRGGSGRIAPPCLAQSLGALDAAGRVVSKGYYLALYLPDASGAGVIAEPANDGIIDADQAEVAWSCLAWPVTRGRTGNSTFFVNQQGEILTSRDAAYDGTALVPPPGAALLGVPATQVVGGLLATGTTGADGYNWNIVR